MQGSRFLSTLAFLQSATPGVWNQGSGMRKREVKLTVLTGLPAMTRGRKPVTHKSTVAWDVPEEEAHATAHRILLAGWKFVLHTPVLVNPDPTGGSRLGAPDQGGARRPSHPTAASCRCKETAVTAQSGPRRLWPCPRLVGGDLYAPAMFCLVTVFADLRALGLVR